MLLQTASRFRSIMCASTCFLFASLGGMYYGCGNSDQAKKHPGRGQDYVSFDISPLNAAHIFSAQGKKASNLFTLSLEDAKVSAITAGSDFDQAPGFSPDGKQIVFTASETIEGAAHIFLCSFDGGVRQQLTHSDSYDTSLSFSLYSDT